MTRSMISIRVKALKPQHGRSPVLAGSADGEAAVLLGRTGSNTVSIKSASRVVLRNLEIDGRGAFVDRVIRGNRIERVGTGMYFGGSDGSDPFIRCRARR